MRIEIGKSVIDVDVEATREAYSKLPEISENCDCNGCRNSSEAIFLFQKKVIGFLIGL